MGNLLCIEPLSHIIAGELVTSSPDEAFLCTSVQLRVGLSCLLGEEKRDQGAFITLQCSGNLSENHQIDQRCNLRIMPEGRQTFHSPDVPHLDAAWWRGEALQFIDA